MPAGVPNPLDAFFSLLALLALAMIARDAVCRLTAGPVRFRLALASQGGWVQTPEYALVVIVSSLLLLGSITAFRTFADVLLL
jgi:hypothetical protein